MDVPESMVPAVPVPMAVETILTPGAVISGFRLASLMRGPDDVKDANCRKAGLLFVLLVSVVEAAAAKAFPSV